MGMAATLVVGGQWGLTYGKAIESGIQNLLLFGLHSAWNSASDYAEKGN